MNNSFGISEKSYSVIVGYLKQIPQIEEVIIFGSRAKGNYKNGSDIDIAVKGKSCTPRLVFDLKGHINEVLPVPYQVDVVDYYSLANDALKEHIDRVGVGFY